MSLNQNRKKTTGNSQTVSKEKISDELERPEGQVGKIVKRQNQLKYYLILGILGFLMIISNFLPWDTYMTMNSLLLWYLNGVFLPIIKTFTPFTWVWSDIVPFLSYFPLFSGILLLIGIIFYYLEYGYGKKLMIGGSLLSIGIYALYIFLFWLMPKILEWAGVGQYIMLEGLRIPNNFGAYLCLIPGIAAIPFIILLKLPELKEEEFHALKKEKVVAIPYSKIKSEKGEKFCSNCGAIIEHGAAFCNQCGIYF